MLTTVI